LLLACWLALPAAAERGALLVYEATVAGNSDLYVIPAAGGAARRLTDDPAEDILPRFTADGSKVVFSSKRTGEWQLFEVATEGGSARRLRTNDYQEWQADPSPDGRWLAFLSNAGGAEGLWIQPWPGGRARLVVRHGERTVLGNPNWSPDGRRIVFSSNRGFPGHRTYVVDVGSGEQRRLSPLTSGACEPRFGRDGRRVAYVRRQHLTRERSQIVEVDLESSEERVLVDWPALNYDPVYAPGKDEIAFASAIAGDFAVYRLRLRDGKAWRVTHGPGAARHPDYQP
jgi:Tol biopolymer transport system component